MKQLLNGTITISPAPQNDNPDAKAELVIIEYHGLDGKYLSSTRHVHKLATAIDDLLIIVSAHKDLEEWTHGAQSILREASQEAKAKLTAANYLNPVDEKDYF